jgi:hypothetical protein
MSNITAGLFENIEQAQDAVESLRRHGFTPDQVSHFANNPPGQHHQFPIGGDENADPGAKHAHAGTAAGAGIGAGAGAAVGAVIGGPPGAAVGAGVGAYIGSLAGTLNQLEGKGTEQHPVRRPAGVMVAALTPDVTAEQKAIRVLHAEGASHIERAQGRWENGKWADFDPVVAPRLVEDLPAGPQSLPPDAHAQLQVCEVRRDPGSGKWEVEGPTPAYRRETFSTRQDAVSFAIELAESHGAAVEVYGKDGGLIWREIYERRANVARRSLGGR